MSKIHFEIEDDVVIKHTPMLEIGEDSYKTEVVMTKEIFQECYKKWVESLKNEDGMTEIDFIQPKKTVGKLISVDVLDKIRDEIENHCGLTKENHCRYCSYCNSVMGVREILEIIDKYKGESDCRECKKYTEK